MNDIPIHFVYSKNIDTRIFQIEDVDKHWNEFIYGRQVWIFQTYCLLKKRYSNITLGNGPKPDCINIMHAGDIGKSSSIIEHYIVNVRADYKSVIWSNFEIVQNKNQEKQKTKYVTHWPQPGLIKRNKKSSTIENVAFLGALEQNILRNYPIEKDLNSMGLNYICRDREKWNDYSNIDLLVAIRQFGDRTNHDNKPPTKLINAWLAEVPLIAGNDSAYVQIAEPGEDYITVNSYDELLQKIEFLQNNPDYYRKVIQNGIRKREHLSRANIINEWINLFKNEIFPDFTRWNKMGRMKKLLYITLRSTLRQSLRVKSKIARITSEQ